MSKLIGNYQLPQGDSASESSGEERKNEGKESAISEFERRAMERLGGSIAFVMKGKAVVWNGEEAP